MMSGVVRLKHARALFTGGFPMRVHTLGALRCDTEAWQAGAGARRIHHATAGTGDNGAMSRVLVANRGEIAVRIAAAVQDLGWQAVAVYDEGERNALHACQADDAVLLQAGDHGGDAHHTHAYLDAHAVVQAARQSGADAVHPGYGWLSESPEFAQLVVDSGLAWIGPSPQAMTLFGDKTAARRLAKECDIPTLKGSSVVESSDAALAFICSHGLQWPVLLKAAFGGGGRGIRRVEDEVRRKVEARPC